MSDLTKGNVIEWHPVLTCGQLCKCKAFSHSESDALYRVIIKALTSNLQSLFYLVNFPLDFQDLKGCCLCCIVIRRALHFVFVISDGSWLILKSFDLCSPISEKRTIEAKNERKDKKKEYQISGYVIKLPSFYIKAKVKGKSEPVPIGDIFK